MVTVRTLVREDIDRVAELTARAFGGDQYEHTYALTRQAYLHCPIMPLELGYCAEIDGRIVAKWQLLDLRLRFGDAVLRAVGSHAVVVDPEFDGQGLARRMVAEGHAAIASLGYDVMLGIAQRGSLYAAMGGATICAEYEWSLDPLSLPATRVPQWRAATDADVPALVDLYNCTTRERGFGLLRSVEQWPWLTRRPTDLLIGDGAYLGLRDGERGLEVREAGMRDPSLAVEALLVLGALARARRAPLLHGHLPLDHPLVEASRSMGAEVRVAFPRRAGVMAGIVDARRLLASVTPELEARHRRSAFADDRLVLELSLDGQTHALRLGDGPRELRASLSLSQGAFVQLLFGYKNLRTTLLEAGQQRTPYADARALHALDALLPQRHPFIMHTDRF